jgi:thiol-disulfide isomerase/thioredoxin
MTQILLGAVIVLGLMASANLLVTFAVIRRIAVVEAGHADGPGKALVPDIGYQVADFSAELLSGGAIHRADLADSSVIIIFVSPGCAPCQKLIASMRSGWVPQGEPLLIFVAGYADDAVVGDTVAELSALSARIGITPPTGPVAQAFGVVGYPTVLRVENGVVTAAGARLDVVEKQRTAVAAR